MIGADGRIIDIGKAVSLRNRVRSYFQDSAAHPFRTVKMVERVADVRTIVVTNEVEALILEANLIKRHQPPFNVRLRDDKRFPYLKVTNEKFPRVVFTRVVKDDGARYFGPYTNAHGLRELIDLVRIVFPLPDDFASMQETLRRRLRYLRQDADRPPVAENDVATAAIETQARKRERFHEKPDLLLIDGGKGQLNAVVEVMRETDMWGVFVAGLAKEHEWLFVRGNGEPIVLPPNSAGLHLVMRIRDEAHRFAITHHRNKRGKAMTKSVLDTLDGVGPVRKKRLMTAFGSVRAIRNASVDEIAAVKGMTPALASQVKSALGS